MTNHQLFRRIYVASVAFLGFCLILWSTVTFDQMAALPSILQLMLLNAITQITSRNIAKSNSVLGVSQAVNLAAVALYGVQTGILVALVASSSVWLYRTYSKQEKWRGSIEQFLFNNGMEVIATFIAGGVLKLCLDILNPQLYLVALPIWGLAALLNEQTNLSILAGILYIQHRTHPFNFLKAHMWSLPISVGIGTFGGSLLYAAVEAVGWQGVLLFLFPILLSAYSFHIYSRETEKQMDIISERTEQLEVANNRMQDLAREKDQMLAVLSHDMRTSLSAIHASVQILTDPSIILPQQKQRRMLHIILHSEQSLTGMVDNILRLEKVQDGDALTMERSFFGMGEVVDKVVQSMETLAAEKAIRLHYYSGNTPVFVDADRQMIQQVIMNLVSNAIKYTPNEGSVFVSLSVRGSEVLLDVEDTGYGIPPSAQKNVFNPYYRVAEHEKKALGTGLGLSIVKRFVEAHGGGIELESKVGSGSRFTVQLPMLSTSAELPIPTSPEPTHTTLPT
ncbi:MAG: sensor histidine kinase [Candidatus Promineifilaceae bacterium]